jgi:hypothetical protein
MNKNENKKSFSSSSKEKKNGKLFWNQKLTSLSAGLTNNSVCETQQKIVECHDQYRLEVTVQPDKQEAKKTNGYRRSSKSQSVLDMSSCRVQNNKDFQSKTQILIAY